MPTIEPASVIWLRAGARDPEVRDLHAPLAVDEHVVRLDVAVHDPVPVREARAPTRIWRAYSIATFTGAARADDAAP